MRKSTADQLSPVQRKFILHWGEMGTRWGVNRTVAQVHALLYISPEPLNADDIVFRKIAEAQGQITKLIQENRKSREILGKFKSAPASTGEEMDTTL